jgi:hypothetical protein
LNVSIAKGYAAAAMKVSLRIEATRTPAIRRKFFHAADAGHSEEKAP